MNSKVCMIAAVAVAFSLASGAAQALPPSHRPQASAPTSIGLVGAAHAGQAAWLPGTRGGHLSTVRSNDGSFIDPNGLVIVLTNILKSLLPPSTPQTNTSHPIS
jgi:hypothetical protein